MKDGVAKAIDENEKSYTVYFVSGPFDLRAKSSGVLVLDDTELVFKSAVLRRELFRVPYSSITGATVDTAERMTLTRVLALGIFAFGFKKKDKLLQLNFNDSSGLNVTVVFGKAGVSIDMDRLAGKILTKRRSSLEQHESVSQPAAVSASTVASASAPRDCTRLLDELASLRDRGVISEDEFQKKKIELLTRI